jgi:hypothetical protein
MSENMEYPREEPRLTERRTRLSVWPGPQDYNEAIQTPQSSFADPQLQRGTPETTELGLPRPNTGMFASVYRVHNNGNSWAVRCFLRNIPNQAWRYAQLEQQLSKSCLPYFLSFEFQKHGIKWMNSWTPIVKMEWCEGETLDRWIFHHLEAGDALERLAVAWAIMARDLRQNGIAHGDLQHTNILVVDNAIKLVDYDGMYVTDLADMGSHELGHPSYQHPGRSSTHFGPELDHFSLWVIYGTLRCLQQDPLLWERMRCSEDRLFFTEKDLRDPTRSRQFRILEDHADDEVRGFGRLIRYFLSLNVEDVPPLEDLDIDPEVLEALPPLSDELHAPVDPVREGDSTASVSAVDADTAPPNATGLVSPSTLSRLGPAGGAALRLAERDTTYNAPGSELTWITIFAIYLSIPAIYLFLGLLQFLAPKL